MKILFFVVGLVFVQFGFNTILMYQANNINTSLIEIAKYTLILSPVLIILNILSNYIINFGNKVFDNLAFTSIANTMMGVIMAFILSVLMFKEPFGLKAILGIVLIFAGVVLVGIK